MSASDRLNDLQRQRALVREHLDWIDREISDAEAALGTKEGSAPAERATSNNSSAGAPGVTGASGASTLTSHSDDAAATECGDTILEKYRRPSTDLQRDVRTGCLLYFAAAFLILAVVIASLYFALHHK